MTPYWLFFLLPAGMALSPIKGDKFVNSIVWGIVGLLCILMIGLRYEVGGDWGNYIIYLDQVRPRDYSLADTLVTSWGNATGYQIMSWGLVQLGLGMYAVNTCCAIVFTVGLMKFCRKQPMPWVALAAAVPYMVYGVAMGYTRQSVAIGLFLWGLSFLREGKELKYAFFILLACTFHLSAIITMPLVMLTRKTTSNWYYYPLFGVMVFGVYTVLNTFQLGNRDYSVYEGLSTVVDYTATRYSPGGVIRIYMNAVPILVALFYWNRIKMISTDYRIIKWMAIVSIMAIPALSYSTTLIDRLGLYLMVVQLAFWPRVIAVQRTNLLRSFWTAMLISYFAVVLFVFFNFANHAMHWLPYQMYPFYGEPIYPMDIGYPENG